MQKFALSIPPEPRAKLRAQVVGKALEVSLAQGSHRDAGPGLCIFKHDQIFGSKLDFVELGDPAAASRGGPGFQNDPAFRLDDARGLLVLEDLPVFPLRFQIKNVAVLFIALDDVLVFVERALRFLLEIEGGGGAEIGGVFERTRLTAGSRLIAGGSGAAHEAEQEQKY